MQIDAWWQPPGWHANARRAFYCRDRTVSDMSLFLDISPLSVPATNAALEFIYKSTHDHGDGDGIWRPHESVLIRRLIELFTRRGLDRLAAVQEQLQKWQAGEYHRPVDAPPQRPGMMERWTEPELALVRLYLESLPPAQWTLDDHMMAVDYVVQRYLPTSELRTEAEWLATRAGLLGKVQANMEAAAVATMTSKVADKILAALPATIGGALSQFSLQAAEKASLEFAVQRAAENVRALSEAVRHRMRTTILQHLEAQQTSNAGPSLQSRLLDEFGSLNRDWRRIAITEAGNAQLEGFIAAMKPGAKVERVEQYKDACAFCARIHGKVATVVAADAPDKDPDTMVWPGKNNIGRSASPRKRVGSVLVQREADEMWWLPAGLVHPNCRGRWVPASAGLPDGDPEFAAFLRDLLA